MQNFKLIFLIFCGFVACKQERQISYSGPTIVLTFFQEPTDSILNSANSSIKNAKMEREMELIVLLAEQPFLRAGLVNVKRIAPSILVDLRYSSTNNFMKLDVYGGITNAYLQPEVAEKLVVAQQILSEFKPEFSLIIYDAARPLSVQQFMWDSIKVPKMERTKYLSNPKFGSLHNYGAAVDIGIVDSLGKELDMGTSFDFFGEEAQPRQEVRMIEQGKLTIDQMKNRQILRQVMNKAGFFNIQTEWWHFNACTLEYAAKEYKIIE